MTKVIKNANIVLTDGVMEGAALVIEDGRIVEIDPPSLPADAEMIDAGGGYLLAGFVDLHVHGGGGADFMDATIQDFEKVVSTHLCHGTTTLYPTAMSATYDELIAFIDGFHQFRQSSAYGRITPGLHLEGPYLSGGSKLTKGAQDDSVIRPVDMDEAAAILDAAQGAILRWDVAPEIDNSCELGDYLSARGVTVSVAHSDATAEQTQQAFDHGFSHVTHFYTATSAHRKREQKVYAGIVEAAYLDDRVDLELIGDGCHIARTDMLLAKKIKGREKVAVITDASRLAGSDLMSGKLGSMKRGVDIIVDDGVAKLCDMTSFAGSIATMDRCLRVLVRDFGISINDASVMLSLTPARMGGCDSERGSIEVGKDADLVITTPELEVVQVILGGEVVYKK